MAIRKIPPGDLRWFVQWRPGGEIALVRTYDENRGADCPKCEAPMLFAEGVAVCYACGMTFWVGSGLVGISFSRHLWPDSACGWFIPYDKTKDAAWYASLAPRDLDVSDP